MKPIYCQNCDWTGDLDGEDYTVLGHVEDLETRIEPGEIVPAGECGNCGALIYLGVRPTRGGAEMTIAEALDTIGDRCCVTSYTDSHLATKALELLRGVFDDAKKQFFCPKCGGSHFGSNMNDDVGLTRNCHSCRGGNKFTWNERDDDKYFRWVITLPADALPNTPKTVTTSGENVYVEDP